MDSERKQPAASGAAAEEEEVRTSAGPRGPDGREAVTDEVVEEFFAVLRRMREVARFFASTDGRVAAAPAVSGTDPSCAGGGSQGALRWRPTFVREDFEDRAEERPSRRRQKRSRIAEEEEGAVAEEGIRGRIFDLNAEPGDEDIKIE